MLCSTSKGVCSGPPPRLAVGGLARRKEHGLTLTIADVYYVKLWGVLMGENFFFRLRGG